jgi:hypothetical protein
VIPVTRTYFLFKEIMIRSREQEKQRITAPQFMLTPPYELDTSDVTLERVDATVVRHTLVREVPGFPSMSGALCPDFLHCIT